MLRLTGRLADGWVPSMAYADPTAMVAMSRHVDEAAVAAGRDPVEIKRVYNITGRFGSGSGQLQGRPRDWAEQLAELTLELGDERLVLRPGDSVAFDSDLPHRTSNAGAVPMRAVWVNVRPGPEGPPPKPSPTAARVGR